MIRVLEVIYTRGKFSLNIPLFPQSPRPANIFNPCFSVHGFPGPRVRVRLLGTPLPGARYFFQERERAKFLPKVAGVGTRYI